MDYLQYVNIKQGSRSVSRFSQGNTLPLVQRPFGFTSFAPQTNSDRGAWFYHPDDRSFEGIRLTHQPSPWIGDWGPLVLTAQTEKPYSSSWQSWSGFDPQETVLKPHYMKYCLKRPGATVELTPTEYGGWFRFRFERELPNYISVLAPDQNYSMWYEASASRLHCHARVQKDQEQMEIYCVLEFPAGAIVQEASYGEDLEGKHTSFCENVLQKAYHLAAGKLEICVKMGVSYLSDCQAVRNLKGEEDAFDFDRLCQENRELWNRTLAQIEIQAEAPVMKTFYSCMYRAFLFPHKAYERDEQGRPLHYAPALDTVRPGYRYTDNGFWDTYRTVYPFLSILLPNTCREMVEGYVQDYRDSGWLPRWTCGTARNCMPGTAIDAVIADGAVKGILGGELLETAYAGMVKHATVPSQRPEYGRTGIADFEKLGYMPCDRYHESVNLTLDASYFDGCIATVAGILGKKEDKALYEKRAKNYRNIFDPRTGFMRGKDSQGNFRSDFIPSRWGQDYTEASAWQTTFAVQHDLEGLAECMGGREAILRKLDQLFDTKPDYLVGSYQAEIHEMTEMAACNWGQCAVSNQPSFHIPYLYAWFGEPEKAAMWVRKICREGFSWEDDGFPGDEDNGSMALWYIFAVLGIYPICPGKAVYTHIPPMAEKIRIHGKVLDLSDLPEHMTHEQLMEKIR